MEKIEGFQNGLQKRLMSLHLTREGVGADGCQIRVLNGEVAEVLQSPEGVGCQAVGEVQVGQLEFSDVFEAVEGVALQVLHSRRQEEELDQLQSGKGRAVDHGDGIVVQQEHLDVL